MQDKDHGSGDLQARGGLQACSLWVRGSLWGRRANDGLRARGGSGRVELGDKKETCTFYI